MDDTPKYPQQRRRRRRRDFLFVLQQNQSVRNIPLVNIGQRLREIRSEHGLSLRDLAKKSGLNVNTLSMIENEKNTPSLETLQQLAFSLDIQITAFFENSKPTNQLIHYQAGERPAAAFAHGILEDLGAGMPRRGAETFLVTLHPKCDSGEHFMVHTGRETVYCLEGQLTYIVENQSYLLQPGDSLHFEAHLPHRWQNNGLLPTRMLLVLSPSDDQDRPMDRHFSPGSIQEIV